MNHNDEILGRMRGVPMQKGKWKDKFHPQNPNVTNANDNAGQCPVCKGNGGSYESCGDDYGMVWLECMECDGKGKSR